MDWENCTVNNPFKIDIFCQAFMWKKDVPADWAKVGLPQFTCVLDASTCPW